MADGAKCEGEYENGRCSGTCRYEFPDGHVYEGQFYKGKQHGSGTCTETDGACYTGQWQNGKRHGTGTQAFGIDGNKLAGFRWVHAGDKYEGAFVQGEMHGIGHWTHAKGGKTEKVRWCGGIPEWLGRK